MPIHDWTRVEAGIFHDFHTAWIAELRKSLNSGLLPPNYYALAEKIAGGIGPDVLTLQTPQADFGDASGDGVFTATLAPPQVERVVEVDANTYVGKQRSLAIRHSRGHRMVALIEIVSSGNKNSRHAIRAFVNKATSALSQGIHLLVIDLYPATPRDPHGIDALVWEELTGEHDEPSSAKPLTLAAYDARLPKSYVQSVAVGDKLSLMPLFLESDTYVNAPLEPTYQAAYEPLPKFYRDVLEA